MSEANWIPVCDEDRVPRGGGVCVRLEGTQIAIFRVADGERTAWFATQNRCPHWNEMVLSRSLTGADGDEPKIACPMHKKTFSLKDGRCLSGDELAIETFPVEVRDGKVWLMELPASFVAGERDRAEPRHGAARPVSSNGDLRGQELDAQVHE